MSDYDEWARQFVHDCVVGNERFEERVKKLVEKLEEADLDYDDTYDLFDFQD